MTNQNIQEDPVVKWARRSSNNERLRAMLTLAHPEAAIKQEQLDINPWLFNCQNGTIDLKSGELLPHRRDDFITKFAPVQYDPEAKAPIWDDFLNQIFNGNKQIQGYVQRFAGYSLTGSISEQCFAFLHGQGANGKTTFVNALREMMGDYAQEAAPDLLLDKQYSGIPNDIARLRGARFVTVTETADNRKFDEGLIKRLTGGDRITARFLRAEFFEFDPTHKLWLISNHKPIIKGVDLAIWRRIKLIPFEMTFLPHQQDRNLSAKLREELAGILAWAVRGSLEWQQIGLAEPEEVKAATDNYKTEMDVVERFIDECCILDNNRSVMSQVLYDAYRAWAAKAGEEIVSYIAFCKRLKSRGFTSKHSANGNAWKGLCLPSPADSPA